jgi:enoyl-CoA hydratase/carnithine racemase
MGIVSSIDWQKNASAQVSAVWLLQREALVVSKPGVGFDRASVEAISDILRTIAEGAWPSLRFLVFDFGPGGPATGTRAPEGFAAMVDANAQLIVDTPVITLAWTRGETAGLDFDFAMNCSAIVAEEGAHFSFLGEPFDLLGLYAALGRRIGFAKAERLIDATPTLTAAEAHDLLLVRDVVAPQPELVGVASYLSQFERRYNSSHAIFRAQRMAAPPIDRRSPGEVMRRSA